jgi:hypothetical protein
MKGIVSYIYSLEVLKLPNAGCHENTSYFCDATVCLDQSLQLSLDKSTSKGRWRLPRRRPAKLERILAMRGTISEWPTMTNRGVQSALSSILRDVELKGKSNSLGLRSPGLKARIPHAKRSRCAWRR